MTLYELIEKANQAITPDTHALADYLINTSDDNGGFLRSCYTKKPNPLRDKKIPDIPYTVIGFSKPLNKRTIHQLETYKGGDTPITIQMYYWNMYDIEDMIYFNCHIAPHNYLIQLDSTTPTYKKLKNPELIT